MRLRFAAILVAIIFGLTLSIIGVEEERHIDPLHPVAPRVHHVPKVLPGADTAPVDKTVRECWRLPGEGMALFCAS